MNDSRLPRDTESNLRRLLQDTFGFAAQIDTYEILNQHADYHALKVTLNHPSLALAVKLAGPDAPYHCPFDRTAMFHRLVAERTTIPMPEVIAVDVSYQRYPWRYLIKTYLPGEEWVATRPRMTAHEQTDAYRQIGDAIAQLHQITFDGFGEVDAACVDDPTDYISALTARVVAMLKNPRHTDRLLDLIQHRASLFATVNVARLCHEDLHHHNILFRRDNGHWQLATILDFDKAWAGHHEIDLAKLELWTGMMGDGFWDTYSELIPPDDGYTERRPIYQLMWCLEYAANTPQHLADTRRLCEQVDLPIIERFE